MKSRYLFISSALTAFYFLVGKWALSFALLNASASPFWPPTGLALASLLIFGLRLWPAILIGSLLVNLSNNGSLAASTGIAFGNVLEAVVGAAFVNQLANGQRAFEQPRDIFKFNLYAGAIATALSATIGVLTLCIFGLATWDQYRAIWLTWWLGNAGGALIFSPFLILWWRDHSISWSISRILETLLIFAATIAVAETIFVRALPGLSNNYPLDFLLFPFMVWAAFRLDKREVVTLSVILSAISVYGTMQASGPFVLSDPNESLLILQAFLIVLTTSKLTMSALVSQQKRERAWSTAQYLVAHELAHAENFNKSGPTILKALGEYLAWNVGVIWALDEHNQRLRSVAFWHTENYKVDAFEQKSQLLTFERGKGLPGRVWDFCKPVWIPDVTLDSNFPRAAAAREVGLHAGFAFPILQRSNKCLGVMEFFSTQVRLPDENLMRVFEIVGNQVGQFLARSGAEAEVRTSEARKRAILESAIDAIITINAQGLVVEVNPAASSIFGYKREEMVGKDLAKLIIPEELRESYSRGLAETVAHGHGAIFGRRLEMQAQRADGSEFPAEVTVVPVPGVDVKLFTGYLRDITEQKNFERRLEERARELTRTNEDLQQFAFAASHDLKEPLRMVSLYSQLIKKRYSTNLDSNADEFIEYIVEGAHRMDALLSDLLEYSQASSASPATTETVDCNVVLEKVLFNLKAAISEAGATIVSETLPSVAVRESDFLSLLQNLLENAIKYRSSAAPQINIRVSEQSGKYCFAVQDNGIGIREEYHKSIFGIFKRLHGERYPGTGVGLAICHKIVERYGGDIWVESEEGKGSTFFFTLPFSKGLN